MSGVLIFKGMKIGILPGDLVISPDKSDSSTPDASLSLSTSYNMMPIWLRMAKDNLRIAKNANIKISEQWNLANSDKKELLISEMIPSLQVVVSCAICVDAFYDLIKPHVKIPADEVKAWRKNKTKRSTQVAESIKRTYKLNNSVLNQVRNNITEIFNWRDRAVHPSHALQRACLRDDISVGVDWKFAVYRHKNADVVYNTTMGMLLYLYDLKSNMKELDDDMESVISALLELNLIQKTSQPSDAPEPASPAR